MKKRLCVYLAGEEKTQTERVLRDTLEKLRGVCESIVLVRGEEARDPEADGLSAPADRALSIPRDRPYFRRCGEALSALGWDGLGAWEEILLIGEGMMGPVFSPARMMADMDAREEPDFWGLSAKGLDREGSPDGRGKHTYEEYVPLRFIAFRKSLTGSPAFRRIWEALCGENGRDEGLSPEAEARAERDLTRSLSEAGFRWDVYVKTPEEGQWTWDYLLMNPAEAIRREGSPFFLKESFTLPQTDYLCASAGEQPWELFRLLTRETEYDTGMLLEELIRTCHQDDLSRTLRMTYILPSETVTGSEEHTLRTALVMHLYYMDLLGEAAHYASSMPAGTDLYVVTGSPENAERVREAFAGLKNPAEIRTMAENRGRDVGSLLVACADLREKYDLICFYHDKKTNHVEPHTAGSSFAYKTAECVLSSTAYVHNVISLFESRPELGMLTGFTPDHAAFLSMLGLEWGPNFPATKRLAEELGFRVPLAEDHIPAIGLGDVFWFRTKALQPLFRKKWTYGDFPPEPLGIDGTVLHAIERLYPFAVQEAGYLPGRVMPDHMASLEIGNLSFYVREYNRVRLDAQIHGDIRDVLRQEKVRLDPKLFALAQAANLPTQLRLAMKRRCPRWMYRAALRLKRSLRGPKDITLEEEEATDAYLAGGLPKP